MDDQKQLFEKAEPEAHDLLGFLRTSATAFQACESLSAALLDAGFEALDEKKTWDLRPGQGYFVQRNQTGIAAFYMGDGKIEVHGFMIAAAHTDSPCLKIKPDTATAGQGCVKLRVEVYGGPIIATWLDRPLSMAGRVVIRQGKSYTTRLVNFQRPVAIIPNPAIHLNREMNTSFEYNKQTQLAAIFAADPLEPEHFLKELIACELNVDSADLGETDLYLYDAHAGELMLNDSLISSARLDNLAMCHALVKALIPCRRQNGVALAAFFDNEEVGSQTKQGAASGFLPDLLRRIMAVCQVSAQGEFQAMAVSRMISTDAAHAVHPNFADKHDEKYLPLINKGPVIKMNAACRYATDAESAAYFEQLCTEAGVPVQKIIGRSDMQSGSTVGPGLSASLGIPTVDVGNPIWAMHSIRETGGVLDHWYMIQVLKQFFNR